MNLETYIQNLYEQTYKTSSLPNLTKLNQDLYKILSEIYNDTETLEKQFKYLKSRILESCQLIIDNMEIVTEKKEDSLWWAFLLLADDGVEKKLLAPDITQKQEELLSKSVDEHKTAIKKGYTHKTWDWTGRGQTTRHKSNDQQTVPINEPFKIINDSTGEIAELMYPGDVANDPTGSNSVICYCELSYHNMATAKHRVNSLNETNINGTILIDNNNVYNQKEPWKLTAKALEKTYNLLKPKLPINVELTHLMELGVDKPVFDKLGYDNVVTVNDVDLRDNQLVITDSTINNADIVPLFADKLINGISINYLDYNDVNETEKQEPLNILSASLINIPSCPACTIQMAKHNGEDNMALDKEDLKMLGDIIADSFKSIKDELIAITKKEPEEEVEKVEDNVKTRAQLKAEIEEELAVKKLDEDANRLVDSLVEEGKVLPADHAANVAMAKANLEGYTKIVCAKQPNPIYNKVVGSDSVSDSNSFKVLNAKFRKGEL